MHGYICLHTSLFLYIYIVCVYMCKYIYMPLYVSIWLLYKHIHFLYTQIGIGRYICIKIYRQNLFMYVCMSICFHTYTDIYIYILNMSYLLIMLFRSSILLLMFLGQIILSALSYVKISHSDSDFLLKSFKIYLKRFLFAYIFNYNILFIN